MSDLRARVLAHTVEAAPWLCPELTMRLITHECPLWYRTEEEVVALGWSTPYWAFAWPGGQALARYLLDNPACVRGLDVVDFGGGGGVEALAAMRAGARRVTLTDLDAVALEAATLNAARNDVAITCVGDDMLGRDLDADVLLAGDMFYDAELAAQALAWMRRLAARGVLVLLGDPNRGNVPDEAVETLAVYEAPFGTDVRGNDLRATRVARVRA